MSVREKSRRPIGRPPLPTEQKLERVQVSFPRPVVDHLREQAVERNTTMTELVREIVLRAIEYYPTLDEVSE